MASLYSKKDMLLFLIIERVVDGSCTDEQMFNYLPSIFFFKFNPKPLNCVMIIKIEMLIKSRISAIKSSYMLSNRVYIDSDTVLCRVLICSHWGTE